jgi:putative chitinase
VPTRITIDQLKRIAPNARSSYRDGFAAGDEVLDRFEISEAPLRVAHFMAQVLHESGALTIQFEDLNYSPERLPKVWPSRFLPKGPLDPAQYAHNPKKLANEVYGGRMGNTASDDGFMYRGRGLLQLTGKDSYAEATGILQPHYVDTPDFRTAPDETIDARWCLRVAAAEWQRKGCNQLADLNLISAVTKAINGGLIGIAERTDWLRKSRAIWN